MRKIKHPKEKIFFFLGLLLYIVILRFFNLTCIFQAFPGIPCPGCGMTRAFLSAIAFDYREASMYHPLWFSLPLIFLWILFDGHLFGKRADRILMFVTGTLFLLVWILRLINVLPRP